MQSESKLKTQNLTVALGAVGDWMKKKYLLTCLLEEEHRSEASLYPSALSSLFLGRRALSCFNLPSCPKILGSSIFCFQYKGTAVNSIVIEDLMIPVMVCSNVIRILLAILGLVTQKSFDAATKAIA